MINKKLTHWGFSVGIVKGLLVGIRQYEFMIDDAYEIDHVLYLGIFQVFITLRYE